MADTTIGRRGNPLRPFIWGGAALLLMLPAIAMQYGAEGVHWTALDFTTMGVMLAVACGAYELGARMSGDWMYRAAFGLAVVTGFTLVWANVAVGVIQSERNPINLIFFGVIGLGMAGALVARFQPRGMAIATGSMAVAQLACAAVGYQYDSAYVAFLISCFAGGWMVSAAMFAHVARKRAFAGG